MDSIEQKLKTLGIVLPTPPKPVANYLGTKRCGNMLFVSARKSELTGEVGTDVTEEAAKEAARNTAIALLSIVKEDIKDLDLIVDVVYLRGFVRSGPAFMRQPYVIDGASDVLIEIFGTSGQHARTATGTTQLPFGASVQLEMILELKPL